MLKFNGNALRGELRRLANLNTSYVKVQLN